MRLIVLFLLLTSFTTFAQVGDAFPDMETESLTHNIISIPEDIKGKYSLLCLAYSKKAEEDLTHWFSPIYNHFISEPQDLFSFNYDINAFFIPMFTGAKRPAYKKVMKKVQETVDPRIQPHVLFYEGTLVEYRTKLEFDDAKRPYFYVVDPEGKIIHATSGEYTDRKMQEIINALAPSLN
ncbi:mitochondrial ATPase complex subunit ATP10 [Reichenbachiella ulvae]|uniref:Mitochondrial ATPase complex subunit ATP10 n=1 Tax=Reichenbachiella ulvae TaxID=2980104 RepID=A0ABT3CTS7_9BACT|nr:mitochondrial ATPase complex subunit ATP10 [Reichenbachiella ulvae]MCV9387078.1 mitochondrial ATPase complex subunit ATP10 [Reichenbachiella ulvae]